MKAVLKPMLLVAAIFSVAWLAAECSSEKSDLRASLGGDRYVYTEWTDEQKTQALSRCVGGCDRYARESATYCQSFCSCAVRNYQIRSTSYTEFMDLLPKILFYTDRKSSGYFCTDEANSADPKLEK